MRYVTIIDNEEFRIDIDKDGNLLVNGEERDVDFRQLSPSLYSVIMEHQSWQVVIEEDKGTHSILMAGRMYEGQVLDERALLMAQRKGGIGGASGDLRAPMPGLIIDIRTEIGHEVRAGDTIIVLESMKMQNELKVPIDGVVQDISVEIGQTVDKDTLLITISED